MRPLSAANVASDDDDDDGDEDALAGHAGGDNTKGS
jgi:hypothetical protein